MSHDSQALAINSSTDSDPGTVRNWVFEFLLASRAIRSGESITTNLNVSPILIWNFFLYLKSFSVSIWNSSVHTLMDVSVKFTNVMTNLKLSCIVHITGRFNGYFLSLSLIKYNHNTYKMMIISKLADGLNNVWRCTNVLWLRQARNVSCIITFSESLQSNNSFPIYSRMFFDKKFVIQENVSSCQNWYESYEYL